MNDNYLNACNKCTIANPFRPGLDILLPAGTPVISTHPTRPYRVLTRAQRVHVHHASAGHVVRGGDSYSARTGTGAHPDGTVMPAIITWPGTGGYWCDAQVTPEVYAANNVPVPDLDFTEAEANALDLPVLPSFEEGYFARFTKPTSR